MPNKRISKSTLSMYLRTNCDRELYLSLHESSELAANGMPIPLQARPGIGVLQSAGREFEDARNEQLVDAFGSSAIFESTPSDPRKPRTAPLERLLARVTTQPAIILQPKFEPSSFQQQAMTDIGLASVDASRVPPIAGLIPDIVVLRKPTVDDEEIGADGIRRPIDIDSDRRLALSIIDVKHTSEANPSYCAEVGLYALLLAGWLKAEGMEQDYFVTIRSYLWTRYRQGDSELDRLISAGTLSPDECLQGLISDGEDANLRFYLPAVLRFFREDLMRVMAIGDAAPDGWSNLEWHVDGRCTACDWLGHDKWATANDRRLIAANPDHYCFPAAKASGHLSQIAGLTRGARKTLQMHSITSTGLAARVSPSNGAFEDHSHLKKERSRIPSRAQALVSSTTTVDTSAVLATLSPYPQLHVTIAVNFDPSSGLLTGLSALGRATAYVRGQAPMRFGSKSFVVDQKSLEDEWDALEGLLSALSDMIDQSCQFVHAAGKTPLTAQIAFWEKRQFDELCAAMGRHLPKILELADRKTRALAWLFPADELLERYDGAVSPCIVFIDEIVRRIVFTPTPHVITLFDTAETYYAGPRPVNPGDAYYREFLTNGVPRERIYEIWSNASTIRRGSVVLPRNTVIQEFGNALDRQCLALNSVVERIRTDFSDQLKANAPKLALSIPHGARGVAFDSKLWVWWEQLQYHTRKLESHQRLALDGEAAEANFEAIRLTNGRLVPGTANEYEFDVLAGSTDAKLDDDEGFLALGKDGIPGLPLERGQDIVRSGARPFTGASDLLRMPLWSSLSLDLCSFDRNRLKAILRFSCWRDDDFATYILANSSIDLLNDVFVTKGQSSFKWYETVKDILLGVGNPPIASADLNAARAMGASVPDPGADEVTPLARVLWDACALQTKTLIDSDEAEIISQYAKVNHELNDSQTEAVAHACQRGLSVVWGPPGTGKTQTLAALIHGLVKRACENVQPLKILVCGPTYKAVEEVIGRTIAALDNDVTCPSKAFVAYSSYQTPAQFFSSGSHLDVESFNLDRGNQSTQNCLQSLHSEEEVTIVATSTMQAYKFSSWTVGTSVGPVFDVAILDESSQIQVTTAISPLATLKEHSRLVVAGDHLQMPPIMALEPPVGSEYLVGSIQKYLLQRNFGGHVADCPLEQNYRSAEDIVAFARTIGYRSSLQSHYPDTALHFLEDIPAPSSGFPDGLPWSTLWESILDPDNRVLALLHEDDLSSQSNRVEAKIVAALVWCLASAVSRELDGREAVTHRAPDPEEFWSKCIGIVTPHRAQRALVVRELRALFPGDSPDLIDSAVDTVEKFQGGQRHNIFVTFGVGDADVIIGEEEFLMQLERTNVAISRAMAKCLVIMPMTLAGHIPQDKRTLQTAHAIKDYVDEFCNEEVSGAIFMAPGDSRDAKLRFHRASGYPSSST